MHYPKGHKRGVGCARCCFPAFRFPLSALLQIPNMAESTARRTPGEATHGGEGEKATNVNRSWANTFAHIIPPLWDKPKLIIISLHILCVHYKCICLGGIPHDGNTIFGEVPYLGV